MLILMQIYALYYLHVYYIDRCDGTGLSEYPNDESASNEMPEQWNLQYELIHDNKLKEPKGV